MAKDNKPLKLEQIERKVFDDQGNNLFSEDHQEADNPSQSLAEQMPEGVTYQVTGYESNLSNHARTVFIFAIVGVTIYLVCWWGIFYRTEDRMIYQSAQILLTWCATITSWIIGRNDLVAISAGAMTTERIKILSFGFYLSGTVSLLVLIQLIYYLIAFLAMIFRVNLDFL